MHVKSQGCIVLFDLLLQQLYGILGQPSYITIYHGSNLGYVTNIILKYFHILVPKSPHTKFGKIGPVVSVKTKF